jgi:hypothetical protein
MPGLTAFQMTEPLVEAMVSLLKANLNTTIDALNAAYADAYPLPHAAQILPFVPIPSTLESGIPAIGVQELGGSFENDIVTTTDALHTYAVVAICQHVDQQTLATQLRRMTQAILYTIQADRLAGTAAGTGTVMEAAGAWSVNLLRYEPGPLLGDLDPIDPDAPPRSYLSWVAVVMQSMRAEQINAGP